MKRHKEKSVRAPVGERLNIQAISLPELGIFRIAILFENISIVNMVQPILGRDEFEDPDRDKVEYEQSNNQIPSSIDHAAFQYKCTFLYLLQFEMILIRSTIRTPSPLMGVIRGWSKPHF